MSSWSARTPHRRQTLTRAHPSRRYRLADLFHDVLVDRAVCAVADVDRQRGRGATAVLLAGSPPSPADPPPLRICATSPVPSVASARIRCCVVITLPAPSSPPATSIGQVPSLPRTCKGTRLGRIDFCRPAVTRGLSGARPPHRARSRQRLAMLVSIRPPQPLGVQRQGSRRAGRLLPAESWVLY